ncbi:MAG: ComEC/Rec2 family competence protein [Deinococcales bacterium]
MALEKPIIIGRQGRSLSPKYTPKISPSPSEPPQNSPTSQYFVAWSLPAAGFLTLGILLAYLKLPWYGLMMWILALGLPNLILKRQYSLLILSLLVPLGYLRYHQWELKGNPLELFTQQELELEGFYDGDYFRIDDFDLPKAKVVLVSREVLPVGMLRLKGELAYPTTKRNPGGFDYQAYLKRRGVLMQLFVDELITAKPSPPSFKERLRRNITYGLNSKSAGLIQAMTLGIKDDLGDLRESFAASGLAHILALSGLHVGILIAALGFLLKPLGLRRYPLLILLILGFMALVGTSPSILRAGLMVIFALLFLWLGTGKLETWPSLALAALVSLMINPSMLFDISFQLSYLAVMGILLFSNPLSERLKGKSLGNLSWWHWKEFLLGSMVVSISAQVLSLPLVLSSFGNLPIFSPLVNVLAIPLAGFIIPLGFFAGVIGFIIPPLMSLANFINGWLLKLLIIMAELGAKLPSLSWGEIAPIGYAFYFVAVTALVLWLYGYLRPFVCCSSSPLP